MFSLVVCFVFFFVVVVLFSFSFFFFFSFSYDRLIKIIIHCRATNKQCARNTIFHVVLNLQLHCIKISGQNRVSNKDFLQLRDFRETAVTRGLLMLRPLPPV